MQIKGLIIYFVSVALLKGVFISVPLVDLD